MTAVQRHADPGTEAARSTGGTPVWRVVEDDRHFVVIDFGDHEVLQVLAAAVADAGLMDEFAILGRTRYDARRRLALDALRAEPAVRRAMRITLAPVQAAVIEADLCNAGLEPRECIRSGCDSYADEPGEFCPPCAEDAMVEWSGRQGA